MRWRSGTLDDLYFEWLYSQVADLHEINPGKTWWDLLRVLYQTEFLYFIPNDDNRAVDGLDMRDLYLDEHELTPEYYWDQLPCSILEMLVALSRRMEFNGGGPVEMCFWRFIHYMGLDLLHDGNDQRYILSEARMACRVLNERLYSPDGHNGGLFPLNFPGEPDQREVELWYQMSAYLREEG